MVSASYHHPDRWGAAFVIFLLLTGNRHSENKYLGILYSMFAEVRAASLSMRSTLVLGSSSIGIWLMEVLVAAVVVMMFGESSPFMVIMLAIVIGNQIKTVPITPGGDVGTYEFALAITFELAGMAPATATVIAVSDHRAKNLVTFVGGVASLYYFGD